MNLKLKDLPHSILIWSESAELWLIDMDDERWWSPFAPRSGEDVEALAYAVIDVPPLSLPTQDKEEA